MRLRAVHVLVLGARASVEEWLCGWVGRQTDLRFSCVRSCRKDPVILWEQVSLLALLRASHPHCWRSFVQAILCASKLALTRDLIKCTRTWVRRILCPSMLVAVHILAAIADQEVPPRRPLRLCVFSSIQCACSCMSVALL